MQATGEAERMALYVVSGPVKLTQLEERLVCFITCM